jgi:hypothetical protein
MKDLAPDITRQRLLIEGYYGISMDRPSVRAYLNGLADALDLRTYGDPIIHAPDGEGRRENEGFDAFVPLIDSGISLYAWTQARFFAVVLFTCKRFNVEAAVAFTKRYFNAGDTVHQDF